jgi:hypothetical protein
MKTVSDKSFRKEWKPNFIFNNVYSENRDVYENMWKNI